MTNITHTTPQPKPSHTFLSLFFSLSFSELDTIMSHLLLMDINDRYGMFACVTRSRHLELWHWPMEALALPSNSGRALPLSKTYLCIDCYTGLYKDKAPTLEIEFVSPTAHAFHVTLLCTPAVYFQSQHPLFILTSKVD